MRFFDKLVVAYFLGHPFYHREDIIGESVLKQSNNYIMHGLWSV